MSDDTILPPIYSPYSQQVDVEDSTMAVRRNWDMGCPWCNGVPGGHDPTCQALSKNWDRKSTLQVQRDVTRMIREEMEQSRERVYTEYRRQPNPAAAQKADERTDIEKRFSGLDFDDVKE